uniref:Transmembrane protein n=1 Tax=Ascaris lumbricoides TaxID=6252 RepID=A0A0M3I4E2_ASCLU
MIESFGTKLFKSLTATADEIGSKFQIAFSNFSDAITEDADDVVVEVISLSSLTRVVLCILIVLLVLIILKYIALAFKQIQSYWKRRSIRSCFQKEFFLLAIPVNIESEKQQVLYDGAKTAFRLRIDANGQLLLNPLEVVSTIRVSHDHTPTKTSYF